MNPVKLTTKRPVTVHKVGPGIDKTLEYSSGREALMFTSMSIADNGYGTKREAQEWAGAIKTEGTYSFKGLDYTFKVS